MHRMDNFQFSLRNLILFGLLLFILETLLVTGASLPWLIGQANADDFYYYLVLARNTAAGYGPSFDGVELTNGFHPMYLSILTLLARLPFETPAFLVKAALILLLFFHNARPMMIPKPMTIKIPVPPKRQGIYFHELRLTCSSGSTGRMDSCGSGSAWVQS